MKIKLSTEILDQLPKPDSQGIIRVTAAIKVSADGKAEIQELNDQPVPSSDDEEEENDDKNPMPDEDAADLLKSAPDSMY